MTKNLLLGAAVSMFCSLFLFTAPATAHQSAWALGTTTFSEEGEYKIHITIDTLGLSRSQIIQLKALDVAALAKMLEEAEAPFRDSLAVIFDNRRSQPHTIILHDPEVLYREIQALTIQDTGKVNYEITIEGEVLPEAREMYIILPRSVGPCIMSIRKTGCEPITDFLNPAQVTRRFNMVPVVLEQARGFSLFSAGFKSGVMYVVSAGADFFLLALLISLSCIGFKNFILQSTSAVLMFGCFQALALYGLFSLPAGIGELVSGIIIVLFAAGRFSREMPGWVRYLPPFFGMINGLCAAQALMDKGLPPVEPLTALLGFNGGAYLSVSVLGTLCFSGLRYLGGKKWYRKRVLIPLNGLIAVCGVLWILMPPSP